MSVNGAIIEVPRGGRALWYIVVRILVCGILLTAAVLKAYDWAQRPIPVRSTLVLAQIGVEWALAIAIFSGVAPKVMRALAMACFAVFAGVAGYQAFQGKSSCSCFGAVQVNPWYTMALDIVIVMLLWMAKPASRPASRVAWKLALLGITITVTTTPGMALLWRYDPGDVILKPEAWVGSALPVLTHIDMAGNLRRGRWMVLFYHHDCRECRIALDRLVRAPRPAGVQLAAVEMSPYGALSTESRLRVAGMQFGKLLEDRKWFLATPMLAAMEDGRVLSIQDDPHESPTTMPWR